MPCVVVVVVIIALGEEQERPRERPWWVGPALLGIAIGAVTGDILSAGQSFAPCAPQDAEVELVVDRFLTRLGSPEVSLRECFTDGRPNEAEISSFVAAAPPTSYRIERVTVGRDPIVNDVRFAAVLVAATWERDPPAWWDRDLSRWILLRRHETTKRWTIEETQPLRRP